MLNTLFEDDIPKNTNPVQDVNITTTILYMSEAELKEFKTLCKEGLKRMLPDTYREKGNVTDYILMLLRKEEELWKRTNENYSDEELN